MSPLPYALSHPVAAISSGFVEAVRPFPVAVAIVIVHAAAQVLLFHEVVKPEPRTLVAWSTAAVTGFFWAVAIRLVAERRGWPPALEWPLAIAGALALSILAIWDNDGREMRFPLELRYPMLAGAAVLLAAAAAGPWRPRGDRETWGANARAWTRCAVGLAAAVILAGGLTALLVALDVLFGWTAPDPIWADAGALPFLLLWPLYTLADLPAGRRAVPEPFDPPPLRFLVVALLVPLCLGYLAVVYAYAAWVLVLGALPSGQVGWLMAAFGTFGIVTWMVAAAPDVPRPVHVVWFQRLFFPLLIVPTVLLMTALGLRVGQYGWTPERVLLGLAGLWFAGSILWWAAGRRLGVGIGGIPAILLLLLCVGAVGPLSIVNLSARSQMARLDRALEAAGHPVGAPLPVGSAPETLSALATEVTWLLIDYGRTDLMKPLFAGALPSTSGKPAARAATLVQAMGLRFVPRSIGTSDGVMTRQLSILTTPLDKGITGLSAYSRLRQMEWRDGKPMTNQEWDDRIVVQREGAFLSIDLGGRAPERIALADLLRQPGVDPGTGLVHLKEAPRFDLSGPGGTMRLHVTQLKIRYDGGSESLTRVELLVLDSPSRP